MLKYGKIVWKDLKYKYMNFDFNKFYICNRYIIIINKLYNIYGINID